MTNSGWNTNGPHARALDRRELVPWGYAPGNYIGKCSDCSEQFMDMDKRATRCERCAMIARYSQAERKLAELAYHES